ncbi:hypothetical protein Q9189_003980 [Teloschistes chrysophthalmus]
MYSSFEFSIILAICHYAFAQSRTPATTLISSSVASKSISQSAATTVTTFPPFGSSDPGAPAWAAAGYGPPAWIASAVAQYQESLRLHGQNATVPSNSTQAPLTSSGPVTASTTGTASLATAPANAPASSISPAYKTVVAVLGTSLFTVIVGLIAYWVLRRRRAKQRKDTRSDGDSPGSHSPSTLHHQPTMEQAFEVDSPVHGRGQPELWDTQRLEMRGSSPLRAIYMPPASSIRVEEVKSSADRIACIHGCKECFEVDGPWL